jgi:hypothetical protein
MVHDALIDVISTAAEAAVEITFDTPRKHRWRVWRWIGLLLFVATGIVLIFLWLVR